MPRPPAADVAVVASREVADRLRGALDQDRRLRLIVAAPEPATAAQRARPLLDRARAAYVAMQWDQALATLRAAEVELEPSVWTEDDLGALAEAAVLRAMVRLALGDGADAEESLRAAASWARDLGLDAERTPPPVRDLWDAMRREARIGAPASRAITSTPPGAQVLLDGRPVGSTPVTIAGAPGRHFLGVAASGWERTTLAVDLRREGSEPLAVALRRSGAAEAARQIVALPGARIGAIDETSRAALARALGAGVFVRVPARGEAVALDLSSGRSARAHVDDAPEVRRLVERLRLPEETSPAAPEARTGFWARATLGAGWASDSYHDPGYELDGSASGPALAVAVSAGATLIPGLALGGGLLLDAMHTARLRNEGATRAAGASVGPLWMLAIVLDWYPRPDGPFRLGLTLGAASLPVRDDSGAFGERVPVGGGSALELGYEWSLARSWTTGVTLRLLGAHLEARGVQHDVAAVSLLGTATFL
jgi:hypothetical protein